MGDSAQHGVTTARRGAVRGHRQHSRTRSSLRRWHRPRVHMAQDKEQTLLEGLAAVESWDTGQESATAVLRARLRPDYPMVR